MPRTETRTVTHTRERAARYVERRRALGLPGWKVASLAALSPYQLVNFETGRRGLGPDELDRLDTTLAALEAVSAQAAAELRSAVIAKLGGDHHAA